MHLLIKPVSQKGKFRENNRSYCGKLSGTALLTRSNSQGTRILLKISKHIHSVRGQDSVKNKNQCLHSIVQNHFQP